MTVFQEIRQACQQVHEDASHVFIQGDVAAYAQTVFKAYTPPVYDRVYHFWGEREALLAYVIVLDAINFGSGYFPQLKKRAGMSGYFTVASSLTDVFTQRGMLNPNDLEALTLKDCALIFGQPLDNQGQHELMSLFTQALNELGSFINEKYDGSFVTFVASANHSAATLVQQLLAMPYYQDTFVYKQRHVPLYKRAQITVSDLALAFNYQDDGYFYDLAELTMFADNLVPHVLNVDGLLGYSDALTETLHKNATLTAGSEQEIEIRAVALHAVELMVEALQADGHDVTAQQLDVALWNRGLAERYRNGTRHRTRTVFY